MTAPWRAASYQAELIADPAQHIALLKGRREGGSDAVCMKIALSAGGWAGTLSRAKGGPISWACVSGAGHDGAKAVLARIAFFVRMLGEALSDPGMRIVSDGAERIELAAGVSVLALPDSVRRLHGLGCGFYIGEAPWLADFSQTVTDGFPIAGPSLGRPDGYPIIVESTPGVSTSPARALLEGDSGPTDRFRRFKRIRWGLQHTTRLGFPRAFATEEERLAYVLDVRDSYPSEEDYRTNHCLQWVGVDGVYFTPELLESARYETNERPETTATVAGFDVAVTTDEQTTAIADIDADGVAWLRPTEASRGLPLSELEAKFSETIATTQRACLDASGAGAQMGQNLVRKWGHRCEAVVFTREILVAICENARRMLEAKTLRIARSDLECIRQLVSIRRVATATHGNVTFAASRSKGSHADRAFAVLLCARAAARVVKLRAYDDDVLPDPDPRFDDRPRSFRSMWDDDATPDIRGYRGTFF